MSDCGNVHVGAVPALGQLPAPTDTVSFRQDVLSEAFYRQLMREELSAEERLRFFHSRVPWARSAAGIGLHVEAGYTDGLRRMIELWTRMGVVVKRPGPADLAGVPEQLYVEVQRGSMDIVPPLSQTGT